MDIEATQFWLNKLFTKPFRFSACEGGSVGINADGVTVTAGFANKDLGLVSGAQVWGMQTRDVRVELFSLELAPDDMARLFQLDFPGLEPGALIHGYEFTAPTLWEAGLPQLTEEDRITTLLNVEWER